MKLIPTDAVTINSKWLGYIPYQQALALQKNAALRAQDGHSQIFGLEHEPVVTLGVRSNEPVQDLPGYTIHKVKRGGHAVIHNPGQLIIYPVCNIKTLGYGVRDFVDLLVQVTQEVLLQKGIATTTKNQPGLYTNKGKLAFFGLSFSKGVSMHGIAINVANDMKNFSKLPLCGVTKQTTDRVNHYLDVTLEDLFLAWSTVFSRHINNKKDHLSKMVFKSSVISSKLISTQQ